jgi:arylsulfatase A-like enzyme
VINRRAIPGLRLGALSASSIGGDWASLCGLLLAGMALACGCRGSSNESFDLAKNLPIAEIQLPTTMVDVGTAEARQHLTEGWGHDEISGAESYAWGLGRQSTLQWFVDEPRDLELTFRCWPAASLGNPQHLLFVVNGWPLPEVPLQDWPAVYSLAIPATALISGWNTITVRYWHYLRIEGDPRRLAVAWDWFQTGEPNPNVARPQARSDGDTSVLRLPAGLRLDYFVRLAPGAELVLDGLVPWGDGAAGKSPVLDVEVKGANDGTPRNFSVHPTSAVEQRVLPLPVVTPQVSRVSLRARNPEGATSAPSGLELRRPVLRGNAPLALPRFEGPDGRDGGKPRARANVIVYLIDALRADHLGCYGYGRVTSPAIDRFASDATLFSRAVAQSSWTRSSVASIFTGLRPEVHGTNDTEDFLPADAVTLAELLAKEGYETSGIITNGNVSPLLGFGQGFERYEAIERSNEAIQSDEVNAHAFAWLAQRPRDRPFFLYVHTIDPHAPYAPPEPYRSRFAPGVRPEMGQMTLMADLKSRRYPASETVQRQLISLYDAEIAFNDASFGAFLDELRRLDLYDSSIIILVSDHGEEFYDHGWWQHGETLYREQLDVPLIIRFPSGWRSGTKASFVAQQIDLLPTIIDYVTGHEPAGVQGRSLLPWLDDPAHAPERAAISYLKLWGAKMESITYANTKLVRNLGGLTLQPPPPEQMFDLTNDPKELHNLAYEQRARAGFLRSLLTGERNTGFSRLPGETGPLPQAVKEQLRALGYGS